MKYCILITGMPGAGKSAVALKISSYFNIRCFAKDEYKEILFDTYGFKSRAEKVKLGTMAMEMMYADAEESMKEGNLFILDNNFENSSKEGLYDLLNKYEYTAITVRLTGDPDVIYKRYVARDLSGTRHRGHVVNDCYPEKRGSMRDNPTRKTIEQYMEDIETRGYNTFEANGPLIEADVTDLSKFDYRVIIKEIKRIIAQNS
ncbi:MAG: AAA family ATPase [Bacilli bacterium]|nr:AAA family ATPase [Bacilli bacterium]